MKKIGCILFLAMTALLPAQETSSVVNIEWETLKHTWRAPWITHATADLLDYGVFHLRRTFELSRLPDSMIVHVSADNRYRLYVNGRYVCNGPARGDQLHWFFETINIAPYLQTGKNVIAAQVVNFGIYKPAAQHSYRTAFILQADDEKQMFVDTGADWKMIKNDAFAPLPVTEAMVHGFYAVSPGDSVDASKYPWGWQEINFDDSKWPAVKVILRGVGRGYMHGEGWYLTRREIPPLEERIERIAKIARSEGVAGDDGFLSGEKPLIIPPQTRASLLLDNAQLTMGYPQLTVNGGSGGKITVGYGEALFDALGHKGHRNDIIGKTVQGVTDVYLLDGGARTYEPLWLRTFRYVQLDIETADEPLELLQFVNLFTAYPFQQNASFECSDTTLQKIWQTGWRTARLCAQETYYDCPFYEQLQYIGDTRIQSLISLYNSGDDRLMRNALKLFDWSRVSDGITQSRYPSHVAQFIPQFSLIWVAMVHDYTLLRNDPEFVRQFLPGIKAVLTYFENHLDEQNFVVGIEWLPFVDWANGWAWGVPPGVDLGQSATLSLQYVYALQRAVELFQQFGDKEATAMYQKIAGAIQRAVQKECFVSSRGIYADTPEQINFSQHTNILTVLTHTAPLFEQKQIMQKVISERGLTQCTLYFRFYLFRALRQAGLGDQYLTQLRPWREALDYGLTTFPENPIGNTSVLGTRSDCHAWSASPNYDLLATVCGIEPAAPGFKSVRIEPSMGGLVWIRGSMPHPRGTISVMLERKDGNVAGSVSLPPGLEGTFRMSGKTIRLCDGENVIRLKEAH